MVQKEKEAMKEEEEEEKMISCWIIYSWRWIMWKKEEEEEEKTKVRKVETQKMQGEDSRCVL
jgi:hypothetical protein